jgi:BirA family biotin operon repressor/biotin-[acetyl-CoA-carboxylase] ligase
MLTIPDRLRALLAARGSDWPAPIEYVEELGSTSDRLKERWRESAPEWSVVLANRQTAGRGRQGHRWISPGGNVFLSVLLGPRCGAERLTLVPLAAGLAVAEGVEEHGVAPRLKWPNDVLVGGRKIAGILAEGLSGPGGIDAVVLGVGVNVSLDSTSLPEELRSSVTSLRAEIGAPVEALAVTAAVLARLTVWYHALASNNGAARVVGAWRARSVAWWGAEVEAREGDELIRGVAKGIDDRGALLIESPGGAIRALLSADVHEVRTRNDETC